MLCMYAATTTTTTAAAAAAVKWLESSLGMRTGGHGADSGSGHLTPLQSRNGYTPGM